MSKSKIKRIDKESPDLLRENMERLKELFPGVVSEGKIDLSRLREILGDEVDDRPERYLFTWAGKRDAIRMLQAPSRATLVPAPEESVNFNETNNIFIEGENLEVLKLLYKSYAGRVKMIYIDPPYNTGKDFIYPDNFADPLDTYLKLTGQKDSEGNLLTSNPETSGRFHSAWLSMMYPRLFVARQLLREDGVICVSIDYKEVANLRLLMNEIFGEENLLSELVWNLGTGTEAGHFTRSHEYILVYARGKTNCPYFVAIHDEPIKHGALKKISKANPASEITFPAGIEFEGDSAVFEGELGDSEKQIIVSGKMIFEKGRLKKPVTLRAGWAMRNQILSWLKGDETHDTKGQKVVRFYFNKQGILWYEKVRETRHPKSVLLDIAKTKDGTEELANLFGKKIMDFPKPVSLLKFLINLNTKDNDIVLDFFAGACPTASATIESNIEFKENKKFVLIQLPEPVDKTTEAGENASELGFDNVADIGKERIRRLIKKLEKEKQPKLDFKNRSTPEDLGFKVFKLAESNYKPWKGVEKRNGKDFSDTMEMFADPLVPGWKPVNVICEVALKEGYSLNIKIDEVKGVKGNKVYQVTDPEKDQSFRICLDNDMKQASVKALDLKKEDLFICRDAALTDELAANLALQCKLKTI